MSFGEPERNIRNSKKDNGNKTEFVKHANSFFDAIQDCIESAIKNEAEILFKGQSYFTNSILKMAGERLSNSYFMHNRKSDTMFKDCEEYEIEDSFEILSSEERGVVLNETSAFNRLNKRERKYLDRLLDGKTNIEIIEAMGVSEKTGKRIKANIIKVLRREERERPDSITKDYRNDPAHYHSIDLASLRYRSFSKGRGKKKVSSDKA